MCLSNAVLVGLSYGFGLSLANICELFRAADARACLRLDGRRLGRIAAFSLVLAVPVAAAVLLANQWLFSEIPRHCLGTLGFIATILIFTGTNTFSTMAVGQVYRDCGLDVLGRAGWRVRWFGLALGMALSFLIIFGGHLRWREPAELGSSGQAATFGFGSVRVDSAARS